MQWLLWKCSGFIATLPVKDIHALKKKIFSINNLLSFGVFFSPIQLHTPPHFGQANLSVNLSLLLKIKDLHTD